MPTKKKEQNWGTIIYIPTDKNKIIALPNKREKKNKWAIKVTHNW